MTRAWVLAIMFTIGGCRSIAPVAPRFLVLFEQRTGHCRLTVVRDTRTAVCFVWVACARGEPNLVIVPGEVCVP